MLLPYHTHWFSSLPMSIVICKHKRKKFFPLIIFRCVYSLYMYMYMLIFSLDILSKRIFRGGSYKHK